MAESADMREDDFFLDIDVSCGAHIAFKRQAMVAEAEETLMEWH